jgi:uncharacterized protein YqjF (DUF2071 family)
LIRPLIPTGLEIDIFDGWCWIGVVPFHMSGVRPRYVPISFAFPELNVRTYVKTPNKGGAVWFFSLDATSSIAVRAARWFGLPYYDAQSEGDAVRYQSRRVYRGAAPAEFDASYNPTGAVYHASPGTLDYWLTERYCLYSARKPHQVVFSEIHHPPWPLQPANVEVRLNTMTQPIGIELPDSNRLATLLVTRVVAWPVVPIDGK